MNISRSETLYNLTVKGNTNTALIITSALNRFYLSGFRSSDGVVLVESGGASCLVDFRYIEALKSAHTDMREILCEGALFTHCKKLLKDRNIKRIGLELKSLTVFEYEKLTALFEGVEAFDISPHLECMRMIKTQYETECITKAQRICERALDHVLPCLKGKREIDVALELEIFMRKNGCSEKSFDTIVVSGENSSLVHGAPGERVIKQGDIVLFDFGGFYNGYASDMSRTVAVGHASELHKSVYAILNQAQSACKDILKAGVIGSRVHETAENIIRSNNYGDNFGHALGHGVGLAIHEEPRLSPFYNSPIPENSVVTIEPGIYLPGDFGMRLEDMVIVNKDGCEVITDFSRELLIV